MKGENRLKILEFVENSAQFIDDILFIFSLPYGTSYSRMKYLLDKRHGQSIRKNIDKQTRRRFDDLLYRLKNEGLVCDMNKREGCFLQLTSKGKKILEKFRLNKARSLPSVKYEGEEEDTLKIIIFDIPEEERRKRNWLREALRNLKFSMLQKSVWAGKGRLPEEFIVDLERINLLPCVEIFAVSKTGSLVQFKK